MSLSRTDSDTESIIAITGPARVDEAEAIAAQLRKLIVPKPTRLLLALGGIDQVDVSFFQILLSLEATLRAGGVSVHLLPLDEGHIVLATAELLGLDLGRLYPAQTGAE
jgi:anti-anti-sigma regulatory factor